MASYEVPFAAAVGRRIRSQHAVAFTECDPFRHMASAAYLEVAVNHRIHAVAEQLGFDPIGYAERTGTAFVVRSAQLHFDWAAVAGDLLQVESWIDELHRSSLTIQVRMQRAADGRSCCRVTFHSVLLDTGRGVPLAIPERMPCVYPNFEHLPWADGHPRAA